MATATESGVGLGTVMACIIPWSLNGSFWWMFFHGILGWLYIIYWAIVY